MKNSVPSYLYSGNATFVEELYESYLNNPETIDQEWREYFDSIQNDATTKDIAMR